MWLVEPPIDGGRSPIPSDPIGEPEGTAPGDWACHIVASGQEARKGKTGAGAAVVAAGAAAAAAAVYAAEDIIT